MTYKITSYPLAPFELGTGLNIIAISSAKFYFNFLASLQDDESELVISNKDKIILKSKAIRYIGDLGEVVDLAAMYAKEAVATVQKFISNEDLERLIKLENEASEIIDGVILNNVLPISLCREFDITRTLKSRKISISTPFFDSGYGKIQGIVDVIAEMGDSHLAIFTNVHQYLTSAEIDYLAENIRLQEVNVLFVERADYRFAVPEATISYYVDDDFIQFPV
ncbi:MAG: type II-A CRISPR-associated protein Csn2 [Lactobacillaceae bacterium]|jgi:CRISPR type II-A-associated protein Csn2|nr:type II-A CRISPR-associated protein Csn2 [Lactobacillaceae bacterium]